MKSGRMVLILIFAGVPAAFLAGFTIMSVDSTVGSLARKIDDRLERTAPNAAYDSRDNPDADYELWSDCCVPAEQNVIGRIALWLLLTSAIVIYLDRQTEFFSERSALRMLAANQPTAFGLGIPASGSQQSLELGETAVGSMVRSLTARLSYFDLGWSVDLHRADLVRRQTIDAFTDRLRDRRAAFSLIAAAALILGVIVTVIDLRNVVADSKHAEGASIGAIVLGTADSLAFTISGVVVCLAALFASRFLGWQHERLAPELERLSFSVLMASRRSGLDRDTRHRKPVQSPRALPDPHTFPGHTATG